MLENWKQWARTIKRDAHALYLAAGDPRVPWYAKALAIAVAAYALSPIDLIPDFIPVLGYVDDLIIVPAGIAVVIRLISPEIMTQHGDMAAAAQDRPVSWIAGGAIVTIWIAAIGLTLWSDALSRLTNARYWHKADIREPRSPLGASLRWQVLRAQS